MRSLLVIMLAFFSYVAAFAQCITKNVAVPPEGENLKYGAYFNWGALWVKGGEASFKAKQVDNVLVYNISAQTMPKWRWIYDLQTSLVGTMDSKTMKPLFFESSTNENKKQKHERITYNNGKLQYSVWGETTADMKTVEVPHPACSYDLVNEVYASRNLDLSQYKIGEQISFNVFFTSQMSVVTGEIVGYEKKKTRDGVTYDCIKCRANSIPYSIFDPSQPVFIWVTNNERHIPVVVECKIKMGYIKVFLEK